MEAERKTSISELCAFLFEIAFRLLCIVVHDAFDNDTLKKGEERERERPDYVVKYGSLC